ncbi:MAG: AbrB/MazE/SpoVT family DNA-binding domain-containing protein [Sphingomonadaceae bacterium]|nr:AbrB/MazE/SpoVT family DNA-binding domain-containing protein [Sphingomonadaceae bacterium]
MGKEYDCRSFKSGNSVAIRIPAALGVEAGKDWVVERVEGELRIREKPAEKRLIDLSGVYGAGAGLKPLQSADRMLEERKLDWTGERLKQRD